jgi:hypothetical protein
LLVIKGHHFRFDVYVVPDWVGALRLVQEQNLLDKIMNLGRPSGVSMEIEAMVTLEERLSREIV